MSEDDIRDCEELIEHTRISDARADNTTLKSTDKMGTIMSLAKDLWNYSITGNIDSELLLKRVIHRGFSKYDYDLFLGTYEAMGVLMVNHDGTIMLT